MTRKMDTFYKGVCLWGAFFNVYKKALINFLRSVKLYILRIAEWTIVLHTWILCRFAFIFLWFRSKQLICHKSMLNNIAMPALKMTNDLMCTGPSSGSLHTLDRTITPSRQIYAHLGLGERWKRRTALERSEGGKSGSQQHLNHPLHDGHYWANMCVCVWV